MYRSLSTIFCVRKVKEHTYLIPEGVDRTTLEQVITSASQKDQRILGRGRPAL